MVDSTKDELVEVLQTGTLKDEKLLGEYRKRKLVEKKSVSSALAINADSFGAQEDGLLHSGQGHLLQHCHRQARDGSHGRAPRLVSDPLRLTSPDGPLVAGVPGSRQRSRSTTLMPRVRQRTGVPFIR